ncbi:MAG: thiamine pyrophosphate-requiring protein [Candidatus Eremiobacteraeota bacterium]|nr:thiamine pyrophosphate-requiring protein [Candidatus Eremiobacteraeota bacterium]MBV8354976.1 thiamine pyrophosphate-requiring protein [Candidatus Eremiobacteraeota bacterium]
MAQNVSDFIMKRLLEWGVRRIYGYPGDGINGLIGAIQRLEGKIEFIQVRHEEQAAFMACAHAKFTGEVGVCLATSGPGAIHLLNGLYDAKEDLQPVVAIVGHAATTAIGGHYQQEVDLPALFKDVASEYSAMVSSPAAARHIVDRALRIAMARRSVTCIIVPKDIQEKDAVACPPHHHNTVHSSVGYRAPRVLPHREDLQRAADVLNAGECVAMLVGAGALGATDEVVAVAERLGAGIAKALLGKAAVPDDIPYVTGTIGLLGTRTSSDMMAKCDTLLMVGTSFPYAEFLPEEGKARGVQIDLDARNLGIRYATEVNLVGDAGETLRALLPLLRERTDFTWRESLIRNREEAESIDARRAGIDGKPINPEKVFAELSPRLPDRCILTGDAGTATNWLARHLKMRRGMKFSLSGSLATMGPAVPYAIAAKFAFPDRVAIALTGDGAMQMNGVNELITVAKYWKGWSDPRLIILVLNNRDLNQVTWEMRIETGDPLYKVSQELPDFPYAKYAEFLGFMGIRVDDPSQIGDAWERALAADRPVVFEAYTDPDIALLPPHISFEQAKAFAGSMLRGDPHEVPVIGEQIKTLAAGLFPGRKRDGE